MHEVYQSVSDHTIYMYIHVEVPRYLVQEVAHGATPPEHYQRPYLPGPTSVDYRITLYYSILCSTSLV